MAIVINKAAVRRALTQWFIAGRAGETLDARTTAALSATDAASASSDYFYDLLMADEDTFRYKPPADADAVVELVAEVDIAAGELLGISADGKVKPLSSFSEAMQAASVAADNEDFFGDAGGANC